MKIELDLAAAEEMKEWIEQESKNFWKKEWYKQLKYSIQVAKEREKNNKKCFCHYNY